MKEKFIDKSISFIGKYQVIDDLQFKKLKYGLEGLYSLVVKLSVVLLLAIITKTFKETGLIILFYAGIRTFSYGFHAKSNIACWIVTITTYNIIPLLIKNTSIPYNYGFIILGISFIASLLWAPADTPKKPLIRKNNRLKCKILSLTVIALYTIIYLFNDYELINNAILYSLILEIIFINPLSYKIAKIPFNNYKTYKKSTTV